MANSVYGGPSWLNQIWNKARVPSPPWPSGVPYTNYRDRGTYDATQGQGDYRGGSKWGNTYPLGMPSGTPNARLEYNPATGRYWAPATQVLQRADATPTEFNPFASRTALARAPETSPQYAGPPPTSLQYAGPPSTASAVSVPGAVQNAGLSNWYQRFTEQHGGQNPEDFYRGTGEGLAEALADLEWSRGFQQMYGRPPTDDDWNAWYYQSRGGGSYGGRELWKKVKRASNNEYRRMLAEAGSKEERNKIKRYKAASGGATWAQLYYSGKLTGARYDQFVKEKGMDPDTFFAQQSGGVAPAPGAETAEQAEQKTGAPSYGVFPVMVGPNGTELQRPPRPPLYIPPRTYWLLR